jgi:hypothetical protein
MIRTILFVALASLLAPTVTLAQTAPSPAGDRVRLAEILPALEGTEIGSIDLGPAPAPGASRTIRRAEILAAIGASGRSAAGLDVPRQTRIERRAVTLTPAQIAERVREAVAASVAPCSVERIVVTTSATVGDGALTVHATPPARPDDGAAVVMLDLSTGALATHLPARVDLDCPDPVVHSGSSVTVVVRHGAVRASAPGVARGEGRVGDTVRVRVDSTGALVEGRVVDASTVEITP